ncbi:MAG: family 1 encapsulin nanocompartment shell protein [Acidimicrobiales bacterium]
MNWLLRERAPIDDEAWGAVDEEVSSALRLFLSARRLVSFSGPHGWDHAAVGTGRVSPLGGSPVEGVTVSSRDVQRMVELRAAFSLQLTELEAISRGAIAPDLAPAQKAARLIAEAEDRLVYDGSDDAGIAGLVTASPHEPITLDDDFGAYPNKVALAVAAMREAGVDGPYGIALGPRCHRGVIATTQHGGYPVLEHIKLILGGPVVWAPMVDGAVVVAMDGDQKIVCGQDHSVGFGGHTSDSVELYITESLTVVNPAPEQAIALRYDD